MDTESKLKLTLGEIYNLKQSLRSLNYGLNKEPEANRRVVRGFVKETQQHLDHIEGRALAILRIMYPDKPEVDEWDDLTVQQPIPKWPDDL